MRKTFIIFLLIILAIPVLAQEPCTDENIMAVKGKWSKRSDANMKGGNQAQVISRIDKIQQLVQAAYPSPRGIEAGWYRSMGGYYSPIDKRSDAYDFNALFFNWYCNIHVKKLMLGTEAVNGLTVIANKFGWFADENHSFQIEGQNVYLLSKEMGELNGFSLFAGNDNGSFNTGTSFSRTMLVSRAGQSPYKPVTRKQYLLGFLESHENMQKKSIEGLRKMSVRSDAEEEVFKQQQMDRAVNRPEYDEKTREKARANFLRGYTTAKQRQQADILRSENAYKSTIKAATDYLTNNTEAELAKPAYVENTSYMSSFIRFGQPDKGRLLVLVNKDYFNNKLPAYAPQFFVVYWNWKDEKPSLDFAEHIQNNFNFKALQAMLDK